MDFTKKSNAHGDGLSAFGKAPQLFKMFFP
jgi:hypothetical protein